MHNGTCTFVESTESAKNLSLRKGLGLGRICENCTLAKICAFTVVLTLGWAYGILVESKNHTCTCDTFLTIWKFIMNKSWQTLAYVMFVMHGLSTISLGGPLHYVMHMKISAITVTMVEQGSKKKKAQETEHVGTKLSEISESTRLFDGTPSCLS